MPRGRTATANKMYDLTWEITVRFGKHVEDFLAKHNIGVGDKSIFIRQAVDEKIERSK